MRDGVLEVVSDPDDYLENAVELAVPRDEIGDLVIRMKADRGTYLRLAWTSAEGPERRQDLAGQARRPLHRPPGFPHLRHQRPRRDAARAAAGRESRAISTSSLPMSRAPRSSWITSGSSPRRRATPRRAVASTTSRIAGEMRHAMHMRPDQELEFALKVPDRRPRLDFGMGVLLDGRPLRFEVTLTQAGRHRGAAARRDRRRHGAVARRPGRSEPLGGPGGPARPAQHRRPGECRVLGQPDRLVGAGQAVQRDLHDRGCASGPTISRSTATRPRPRRSRNG